MSSAESRVLNTSVESTVRPFRWQKRQIIVLSVERKSLWVTIDQFTVNDQFYNGFVFGLLVPPVYRVWVGGITWYSDCLPDNSGIMRMINAIREFWNKSFNVHSYVMGLYLCINC